MMPTKPDTLNALVTGGAAGIGAAIVARLASEGYRTIFCDIDRVAGEDTATRTGATFVLLDATDGESVAHAVRTHPPFDVLVNNVGVDQHAFFTETRYQDWQRLIEVNLFSAFAFTSAVLPAMQERHYGRIINIASEAGRLGSKGGAIYAAAKAGLIGFTRSIARENARYGITANAILPGPVRTLMVEKAITAYGERLHEKMAGLTLVGRLGEPEEVAAAIAFLASRDASFVTGEALGVSGGMGCGAG
jgi:NAD(P)-dependent dehydrogenase (short-subunit alcohol dehydrogenase family)